MGKIGFVFPGQGSQRVGMGFDLSREYPQLVDLYYRPADDILGFGLSQICWEGPAVALQDTAITQPALFLTSLCTQHVLSSNGVTPQIVAGHSLGEYAALVTADVLDWAQALRLVRRRGQLMAGVNASRPGTMVAILGLPVATVEDICAESTRRTGGLVEVANDNEPAQVVVSGEVAAVREAVEAAKRAGAQRAVPLTVGAPFHCGLMAEVADEFRTTLDEVNFRDPICEVVSSVTGEPVSGAAEAKALLTHQLTGRVRWRETVTRMVASGVDQFVEVGPGKVLRGLCRRISPGIDAVSTSTALECRSVVGARFPVGVPVRETR